MDDLIYFLLVIGWLAFSFYQQAAKKKKAAQMKNTPSENSAEDESYQYEVEQEYNSRENERTPEPDFKKVLEELLMGNESGPAQSPQQKVTPADDDQKEENVYQKYLQEKASSRPYVPNEKIESLEERRAALENEMVVAEEDGNDAQTRYQDRDIDFDLRKAIIYSEILNRRYAN